MALVNDGVYPRAPLGVLADGTAVLVRSWEDGAWVGGFLVAGILVDDGDLLGYRVRRTADRVTLRSWIAPEDVMPRRPTAVVDLTRSDSDRQDRAETLTV